MFLQIFFYALRTQCRNTMPRGEQGLDLLQPRLRPTFVKPSLVVGDDKSSALQQACC